MSRAWCVLGLLGMVAAMPSPATAGPISDPIIGVRGGKFGSPPIDSGREAISAPVRTSWISKPASRASRIQITQSFER